MVYVWDKEKSQVIQRLRHHEGLVYNVSWNLKQALFLSCSEDGTLASWYFKSSATQAA
jgi:WD40 repeat protein